VRIAPGASGWNLMGLVLLQGVTPAAVGVALELGVRWRLQESWNRLLNC